MEGIILSGCYEFVLVNYPFDIGVATFSCNYLLQKRSKDYFSLADTEKSIVLVHAIKIYRTEGMWVRSLLNVTLDRVNGELQAPVALSPGKEPVVLIEKEAKGAAVMVWTLWEYIYTYIHTNFFPLPAFQQRILGRSARGVVTITAPTMTGTI
jgi:hypothetical protein